MSDNGAPLEPDVPDDVAAEYVLGVLDGETRRRATERLARDADFKTEVEAWERRLAPMLHEVAEVAPPAAAWNRLVATLRPASGEIVALRAKRRLRDRFAPWLAATATLAAAAGFVAAVALRPTPPLPPAAVRASPPTAPAAALTANLAESSGEVLFVAVLNASRRDVTVIPVRRAPARGRSPELWIIPPGGHPIPVGLIGADRPRIVASPALSRAAARFVLAVSLEPSGGSPTGAPTGPVVATGALSSL